MDEPEAMQEDGDNWNQEEMVDAGIGLTALNSDLQSSGASTSSSPPLTVTLIDYWYQYL